MRSRHHITEKAAGRNMGEIERRVIIDEIQQRVITDEIEQRVIADEIEQRVMFGDREKRWLFCVVIVSVILQLPMTFYYSTLHLWLQMLLTAGFVIYIGAHTSLRNVVSQEKNAKSFQDDVGDNPVFDAVLCISDAVYIPLIGSITLVTLYLCYRFGNPRVYRLIATSVVLLAGYSALHTCFDCLLRSILSKQRNGNVQFWKKPLYSFHHKCMFSIMQTLFGEKVKVVLSPQNIICPVVAIFVVFTWWRTKNYVLNNIIAGAICIKAVATISLGNFFVAAILLVGLFIYDVVWVFATNVMVTVAQSIDAPFMFVFFIAAKRHFLGLGDVALPGLFLALILRFDYALRKRGPSIREPEAESELSTVKSFPKFYFFGTLLAYGIALLLTVVMMSVFKTAQPALLYIVPCCLGYFFIAVKQRGDWCYLLTFAETEENDVVSED